MKENDNIAIPILEESIRKSLQTFEANNADNSLSDLFLRYDKETQTLFIYDDTENLLNEISFEEKPEHFKQTLRQVLQDLDKKKLFDKEFIYKPFTVSLIDENFLIKEELIFIDDETVKLDDDLWRNLEKELDDFLKNLLEQ